MAAKKKGTANNYKRGRAKEYSTMKKLRECGYDIVFRSAGSHSPIDVIGINTSLQIIKFIQNKPKSMSQLNRDKILIENQKLNNEFLCTFEVI